MIRIFLTLLLLIPSLCQANEIATRVNTVTTAFNNNLSTADTTVQAALDTIDNISLFTQTAADARYIQLGGGSTTSAVIPLALGLSLPESGQDTFQIDKSGGLFRIRNTTDGRNDLTISGAGQWNISAPDGFYVNSPAFFTSTTEFRGTTTLQDNQIFYIGDGSGQFGNAYFTNSSLNTQLLLDISTYETVETGVAGFQIQGGGVSINTAGTRWVGVPGVQIGPSVSGSGTGAVNSILSVGSDVPVGSGATIGSAFALGYSNTTNTASQFNAVNQVFRYNSTGNLTSSSLAGASGGRARLITGSGGTGRITLGSAMSIGITGSSSTATLGTDIFGLYGEVNGVAGAQFDRAGHSYFRNFAAPTGSGFITNLYGSRYEQLTRGTNNYEIALEDAGGVWFRVPTSSTAATERIYSSAASTLDDNANTTRNFRIATAIEAVLTANTLTFNNGTTDTFIDWTTDATLKFGVSSTAEISITATQIDLGSATSDLVNFIAGAGASAPGTALAPAPPETYYGTDGTIFLSPPNAWMSIKSNGTTYKIPLYS